LRPRPSADVRNGSGRPSLYIHYITPYSCNTTQEVCVKTPINTQLK